MNTLVNQHPTRQDAKYKFTEADIDRSIPDRWELIVRVYPDRVAVKTETERLTYSQLNLAANHLARSILAQVGASDSPIPILFEHGAMMVVAMLGVLKAGKSWVPIDPWYPPARISYILQNVGAEVLVTNRQNYPLAREILTDGCDVIDLDGFVFTH
jgi:non-ribosomal peptide synthetase component F